MPPPHRAFLAALAAANNNTGTGTGNRTNSGASTNSSGGAGRGQDGGAGQPVAAANVRAYVLAAAATGSGHPRGGELRDAYDCTVRAWAVVVRCDTCEPSREMWGCRSVLWTLPHDLTVNCGSEGC